MKAKISKAKIIHKFKFNVLIIELINLIFTKLLLNLHLKPKMQNSFVITLLLKILRADIKI